MRMNALPIELTDNKPKIFLCATAYQIYVALKLVQAFDVKSPILFVGGKNRPPKITNTLLSLVDWQKIYYLFEDANQPKGFLRLWRTIRQQRSLFEGAHIFSGSMGETYIAMILGFNDVASVSIFDDGMEALLYLDGFRFDQSQTIKRKIFNVLFGNLFGGKILGFRDVYNMSHRFYTFFDLNVDSRTIRIPTKSLSSELVETFKPKSCIILGQPFYQSGELPTYQSYTEIITTLSTLLLNTGYTQYYYPHPREKILPDKCWKNISIIEAEDIIQVWIEDNFMPELFVGLTTTALISLHSLFPLTNCVAYDITDRLISRVDYARTIYKEMPKYGVEVRDL